MLVLGLLILPTLSLHAGAAQQDQDPGASREYRAKASFLYNVAKFVVWPDLTFVPDDSEFIVGILGTDAFSEILDTYRGKRVGDRPITIRRIEQLDQVEGVHLLFIGKSGRFSLADVLEQVRDADVLTVADAEGFVEAGGMIEIFVRRNRLRFSVNLASSGRAGLTVSSQLLDLAESVHQVQP